MKTGTIVKNTETGQLGIVVQDSFGCCTPNELAVVYEGTTSFLGTDTGVLKEIGTYDATPDYERCGAGKGAACCIFLAVGVGGFCCERFSGLRDDLIFRDMKAKRNPPEPYPECMNQSP